MTSDQIRSWMKEQGLLPPRPWQERPTYISSTGGVFEPYIPPEGDGKLSAISLGVCLMIHNLYPNNSFIFCFIIGSKTKCRDDN